MKSLIVLLLASSVSSIAMASDSWSSCSSADGFATLDWGQLEIKDQGTLSENSFQVEEVQVINEETQTCTLQKAQYEVVSYTNKTSVKKVTFDLHEPGMFPPSVVYVICEEGGSGIPANDFCEEDQL